MLSRTRPHLLLAILALWLGVAVAPAGADQSPARAPHHHGPRAHELASIPDEDTVATAEIPAEEDASAGPVVARFADAGDIPRALLLTLLMAAAPLAWRQPRRGPLLVLALMLVLFAYEDGIHSVHHGFDPGRAEECAVASASPHLAAISIDAPPAVDVSLVVTAAPREPAHVSLRAPLLSPDRGRAPPSVAL